MRSLFCFLADGAGERMTRDELLLNFFNIEQPTTKQIIEAVKVLIKKDLGITHDLYSINSLTGQKDKKISIIPTSVDSITDEKIMTDIAKVEAEKVKAIIPDTIAITGIANVEAVKEAGKVKTEIAAELVTTVEDEVSKQLNTT